MKKFSFVLLLAGITVASCQLYEQDDYVEQYFVESYLVADEYLPSVRLSTTVPFDEVYDFEEAAVSNAIVRVHLLDDEGGRRGTFLFDESSPGLYMPRIANLPVMGRQTYELEITFPDSDDVISAFTTVPDTFNVVSVDTDSTVYQSADQLMARFSTSYYPGRQNYYIFSTRALEPESYDLTPFWKSNMNGDEAALTKISSGIINEENYEIDPADGTLLLRYPWIGVAYYGPNEIITYAIDDNIYDFYRSQAVQFGGSTLSPGEIQNIIYNIDGGIGLFGSMAGASVRVYVEPEE